MGVEGKRKGESKYKAWKMQKILEALLEKNTSHLLSKKRVSTGTIHIIAMING